MTADIIALPIRRRRPLPRRAQPGIRRRLAQIGEVLELEPEETERASVDLDALISFAERHGQSLDWICMGRVDSMIARLARATDL